MDCRRTLPALVLVVASIGSAAGQPLSVGQTYPVEEQSALEEMQRRTKKVDWPNMMSKVNVAASYNAMRSALPRVIKASTREYTPYYTLETDITDKEGNTLYPKGFKYNPLDYFFMPGRIVFIGDGEMDWKWLSSVIKGGDRVITAGGDTREIQAKLGITAFLYEPKMQERLGVTAVPAIIEQQKNKLVIKEIVVDAPLH